MIIINLFVIFLLITQMSSASLGNMNATKLQPQSNKIEASDLEDEPATFTTQIKKSKKKNAFNK
jgi:hypothetical protein